MATSENHTMFNEPNWVKNTLTSHFSDCESELYMPDGHNDEHFEFWLYNRRDSMKVGFRSYSGGILVLEHISDIRENLRDNLSPFELISGCFEGGALIDLRNFLMNEGLIPSYIGCNVESIVFKEIWTPVFATSLMHNPQILYAMSTRQNDIIYEGYMEEFADDYY